MRQTGSRVAMQIRRWAFVPAAVAVLALASVVPSPALAQPKKDQKLDKVQQQELQTASKITDSIAAGQPVASDIGLTLRTDYLKALNGLTFVPFVVSLDPAHVNAKSVML